MFNCRFIEHFPHCSRAGFVSANVTPWAGNSLIEGGAGYIRCCLMGCLSWVRNLLCCRHFHSWVARTQSLASMRGSMKPLQMRIRRDIWSQDGLEQWLVEAVYRAWMIFLHMEYAFPAAEACFLSNVTEGATVAWVGVITWALPLQCWGQNQWISLFSFLAWWFSAVVSLLHRRWHRASQLSLEQDSTGSRLGLLLIALEHMTQITRFGSTGWGPGLKAHSWVWDDFWQLTVF